MASLRYTKSRTYTVLHYFDDVVEMYVANAPDVPGSTRRGATVKEALADVTAFVESYLQDLADEGKPIPEPRIYLAKKVWVTMPIVSDTTMTTPAAD